MSYGQNDIIVSDNIQFNTIIKGFSGFKESPTGAYISAQIEKANPHNGIFRNVVRLWFGNDRNDYINLHYSTYPTRESAEAALKPCIRNGNTYLLIDWDSVTCSSQIINLSNTTFCKQPFQADDQYLPPKALNNYSSTRMVEFKDVCYKLSFEGLKINQSSYFEGIDAETSLNVNYYSREKRLITVKGTDGKAWAEIIDAPDRKGKVLHFIAHEANDRDVSGDKIRVTGNVGGLKATEIVSSVDIYVPRSWKALTKTQNSITWLTIQEFWCAIAGIPVDDEPQFRMTLGMLKKAGKGNKLYFNLKAQDLETICQADGSYIENYSTLYEFDDRDNKRFEIPFGKWFNLRTEILAGDSENGHFRLVATDKRGREIIIFDEICQTFATGYLAPDTKRPLYKVVSPLKLYSSAKMLQYMKGKPLDIYYDNWDFKAICIDEE